MAADKGLNHSRVKEDPTRLLDRTQYGHQHRP